MTRSRKSHAILALCVSAGLAVVGVFAAVSFLASQGEPDAPLKEEFYEVKGSGNPKLIARDLEKAGIVSSGRYFYWYARLTGKSSRFKAGDYRFTNHMHPSEVAAIIMSGISYGVPLIVPEGDSMAEIADAFDKLHPGQGEQFLRICADARFIATLGLEPAPQTLEGFLYPETYLVSRKTLPEEVVRNMVRKFKSVFTPELVIRAKELGFTELQAVTLASIIEKETGAPDDRGKIASVFHNRLKKRMRLQSDPTVIYGMKDFEGKIHKKDLETPTPYNTYTIPGLPPGPISNPGKAAIMAALYPPETPYLYFVSHNDGTSEFSSNLADHDKAVATYQLDPKAREGKSWRDLDKRRHAEGGSGSASRD